MSIVHSTRSSCFRRCFHWSIPRLFLPVMGLCLIFQVLAAAAENPHWIWDNNHGAPIKPDDTRYFRKTFPLSSLPSWAMLSVAADDEAQVFVNGQQVGESKGYEHPTREEIARRLQKGTNVIT